MRSCLMAAGLLLAVLSGSCEDGTGSGPAPKVGSVTVTPGSRTLISNGASLQLTATLRASNGNVLLPRPMTWSSDEPVIARVDSKGLVTGVSAGSTTVTATCEGVSGTATITVVGRVSLALAFVSKRDGNEEIYGMNADGSVQINLTNNTLADRDPVWS